MKNGLWEAIYDEIYMLNDDYDDENEKLTDAEIETATDRFFNGNYIWELIDGEILDIIESVRNERE